MRSYDALLFVGSLTLATGLYAQGDQAGQLAKNSPFLPAEGPAATPVTENAPIEFRGVLVMGGRQQFNFFDPTKRQSFWVGMNDANSAFLVKNFDAGTDRISVEYGGRPLSLTLEKSKISPAAVAPMPAPGGAAQPPGGPVPNPQPVVLNPTPADEAKRLESIASEVRRRRALRQQQAGQQNAAKPK